MGNTMGSDKSLPASPAPSAGGTRHARHDEHHPRHKVLSHGTELRFDQKMREIHHVTCAVMMLMMDDDDGVMIWGDGDVCPMLIVCGLTLRAREPP